MIALLHFHTTLCPHDVCALKKKNNNKNMILKANVVFFRHNFLMLILLKDSLS